MLLSDRARQFHENTFFPHLKKVPHVDTANNRNLEKHLCLSMFTFSCNPIGKRDVPTPLSEMQSEFSFNLYYIGKVCSFLQFFRIFALPSLKFP